MNLEQFCVALHNLPLSHAEKPLAILWFSEKEDPGKKLTAGWLAKIIHNSGIGNPHSTQLGQAIKKTKLAHTSPSGFSLKPTAKAGIEKWLAPILGPQKPSVDQNMGFLPEPIWLHTRPYIEKIAQEINGCYQFGFYNGAAVLLRRLVETLLVEAYEHLKRQQEIKDSNDNYRTLRDIISHAVGTSGLSLGRESRNTLKDGLNDAKTIGDRSAHNRRYTTNKPDLDKIQSGVRLVVDELIQLAQLQRDKTEPSTT